VRSTAEDDVEPPVIFPKIIRYCQVVTKERYSTDVKENDLWERTLPKLFCEGIKWRYVLEYHP
jgi:hypothetical protein